jgi:hypothetical protein
VARLAGAKAKIDEQSVATGAGPVSWADLLYMAGKTAVQASWAEIKVRAALERRAACADAAPGALQGTAAPHGCAAGPPGGRGQRSPGGCVS